MIVLDASVLIGHLDGRDPHHARAKALLEASGGEPLGASAITLAETLVAPARAGRLEDAQKALERLGVGELDLGEEAPIQLAKLRAKSGLKLPDCCVLLAAQQHAGSVASFDADLSKAAQELGLDAFSAEPQPSTGGRLAPPQPRMCGAGSGAAARYGDGDRGAIIRS